LNQWLENSDCLWLQLVQIDCLKLIKQPIMSLIFFSFAYTTSPAAVMKLVVFFKSSKLTNVINEL